MKKRGLLIVCLLLLIVGLHAQNSETFSKIKYYFGDSVNTSAVINSIVQYDSNYIIALSGEFDSTYYDMFIMRVNKKGEILDYYHQTHPNKWFATYDGTSMIVDRDSNIVVCGAQNLNSTNRWIGYVLKLTPELDTIWTQKLFHPGLNTGDSAIKDMSLISVHQTSDEGYIIVGEYYSDMVSSFRDRTLLIKINKNGTELWRRYYTDKKLSYTIDVTNDGGFVFPDFYSPFSIVKTDSLGNVIWDVIPNDSVHLASSGLSVKDNYIIAASPYRYNNAVDAIDAKFGIDVVKLDQNTGQIIWNKRYRTFQSIENITLTQDLEVEINENDEIVIVGTTTPQHINGTYYSWKAFMIKLNSNGDSLWCHFYNKGVPYDKTQFNDVVFTEDGGLLGVGFFLPGDLTYNPGALLIKTDSLGMNKEAMTVSIKKPKKTDRVMVKMYPNPANSILNIAVQQSMIERIEVFNTLGELIYSARVNSRFMQLDVSAYSSGVHLIRLHTPDGILSKKMIVE